MEKTDKAKIKVLVLDDQEDITEIDLKVLQYYGFTAFGALDGGHALEIFRKERPQICILEVGPLFHYGKTGSIHPTGDGMDVLKEIKQIDPAVVCIVITIMKDDESRGRALELGADHYFFKPVSQEIWLPKVETTAERWLTQNKKGNENGEITD